MRKEYYNYSVKMPAVLHEMFRAKVADYHFPDMNTVITHLITSYASMCRGKKVPRATQSILARFKKIPNMEYFFRHQEKSVYAFEMDFTNTDDLECAIKSSGLGNRTKLAIRLICCFVSGTDRALQKLIGEIPVGGVFHDTDSYLIHTYVSNYQYVFLRETAAVARLSVEGMLTAAAELLIRTDEGTNSGYYTPETLLKIADRVLAIKGSTLKDFRRQKIVSIRTNTIGTERIRRFMRNHDITSPREFLRRVVLFFLEARYLIYQKELALQDNDLSIQEQPDWEETMYEQFQKRDFARSIYSI
jgi:hypothetical protein